MCSVSPTCSPYVVLPFVQISNTISTMKTVTVKLPDPLAAWLARRARELGRPQSDIVREALERASDSNRGASCHDVFADVCGIVDGPEDLSTNPKHLAGFGQ